MGGFATADTKAVDSSKFGERLYQIISDPDGNFLYKERVAVVFFDAVVIIQSEQKVCFYQKAFQQVVIPKYKINGINISKSQVPVFVIFCGWVLVILSIAIGFTAKKNTATQNGDAVIVYQKDSAGKDTNVIDVTKSKPPTVSKKANIALGVILLSCGVLLIAAPYFNSTYYVTLQLSKPKVAAAGLAGLLANFLPDPYTQSFRLVEMPDANKLMDYAYGNLAGNMDKMHALSHLIQDEISDIIKPNCLADVA